MAQTGREKERMAMASGDSYNLPLGPHAHLYSQQALLSEGAPLQGKVLPVLDLPPHPPILLSFLCDTVRGGGNMTLSNSARPGQAQPSQALRSPGWVVFACALPPLTAATARLTHRACTNYVARIRGGRKAVANTQSAAQHNSSLSEAEKRQERPSPKSEGQTPPFGLLVVKTTRLTEERVLFHSMSCRDPI